MSASTGKLSRLCKFSEIRFKTALLLFLPAGDAKGAGGGCGGGEAGRGESNFLLPLDCMYRLLLLTLFPRGITALWGGSASPSSTPTPSLAAMGAAVGVQAAVGPVALPLGGCG